MTTGFDLKVKQELADHLGGQLIEYDSTISLGTGRDSLRIYFYGHRDDDRVLIVAVQCGLNRAKNHSEREDSRPSLDGLPALLIRRKTIDDLQVRSSG